VVTNAVLHASITPSPGRDLDLEMEPLIMPAPVGVPAGLPAAVPPAPVPSGRAAARKAAVPAQQSAGPGDASAWPGAADRALAGAPAVPREFRLRLRRGATSVWVEVFDPDLRLPRIRTAGETDEGGRGLYLVEQLATRWGSRPTPEGKAVWFEMPRSGDLR
jgi:hypothetical protein